MSKKDTPEGKVKADCLEYLRLIGAFVWNNPTGAYQARPGEWVHFGKTGSADIIGLLPGGRFIAVECKADTGRVSGKQQEFLEQVRGMGGIAIVARSYSDIADALLRHGFIAKKGKKKEEETSGQT
jgi:hypothetical protein